MASAKRSRLSERRAREAVSLLESLPHRRELARAYSVLAFSCDRGSHGVEAAQWASRALELAERVGDESTAVNALMVLDTEQALERARRAGLDRDVATALTILAGGNLSRCRYREAARYIRDGLDFCEERGFELSQLYLPQTAPASSSIRDAGTRRPTRRRPCSGSIAPSTSPRILALCVLALVRLAVVTGLVGAARRGRAARRTHRGARTPRTRRRGEGGDRVARRRRGGGRCCDG